VSHACGFRFLGSLEVFDGVGWTGIGASQCRSLVASLLAGANEAFSVDRLVFELWGDLPPKTVATRSTATSPGFVA
jgi:hypothetical protein